MPVGWSDRRATFERRNSRPSQARGRAIDTVAIAPLVESRFDPHNLRRRFADLDEAD